MAAVSQCVIHSALTGIVSLMVAGPEPVCSVGTGEGSRDAHAECAGDDRADGLPIDVNGRAILDGARGERIRAALCRWMNRVVDVQNITLCYNGNDLPARL